MATTTYRSAVPGAGDGFRQLLRAEWTKLRSVRSTVFALTAAILLTVLLSVFAASGGATDANQAPTYRDEFSFLHQPLTGDGTVVAHVVTQDDSHEWAKAGIMLKANTTSGSSYAAMLVTPRHGVRMQVNFDTEIAGTGTAAPRWLRLTRSGATITGYESADGSTWSRVGAAQLGDLPPTVEAGLFVSSPPRLQIIRGPGSTTIEDVPTAGRAVFDQLRLEAAGPAPAGTWTETVVAPPPPGPVPTDAGGGKPAVQQAVIEPDGTFTLHGSGDLAALPPGGDDDIVELSLVGILIGLMAVVTLGVLYATSEYKTGLVRTTFTASPRRGRVFVAKAVVLASATFAAGLIAAVGAFLLSQPILRGNGFEPPAYPHPSLADGPVLRAVVGAALFLAVLALFSLGVGTVLRRSAGAIALVIALVIVPQILSAVLVSLTAAKWAQRLTPNAGFAIMQTRERYDTAIGPWVGFGVLCAYAVVALAVAWRSVRRRDA